jgi:UDP-N-acetylmuramoyl-tripeptide--D-alanyl-D-alanine ligase
MKKLLEKILAALSKAIVKKYNPQVVGITGSMGKTSAKEAVYAVLNTKFSVRKNIKNYNNEIGVPLTIIGKESGGKSAGAWLKIFFKAIKLIFAHDKEYPEVLVLEMGADKPGDIGYLTEIIPCHVGVVTTIGPAHLEAFKTVENVAKEKQKIVSHLTAEDTAILNSDDSLTRKMHQKTKAKVIFFGYNEEATVRAVELSSQTENLNFSGIKFKIAFGGSTVPIFLPGVVGAHQINAALIAASVGIAFGLNLIEISEGLKNYSTPRGRMSLVEGRGTLIIDDTYNSSPRAAGAALEALSKLNTGENARKVAILGDMLELGDYTDEAHFELGKQAAQAGVKLLICVGNFRNETARGALENGLLNTQIVQFKNSDEAVEQIAELIQPNDLILIKGSQGARMEKVVKALMKEPARASELLVRQGEEWLK